MNPIYKFELTIGTTTQRCYPIYNDDLTKDFELQSNQQFFRAKLSGKLTFESADYSRIVGASFDTQFLLELFISYNAGQTWTSYWSGTFWKTDCEFDGDAQTVKVTPTVNDQYNDVLAGMEREYNLIDLLPEIIPVKLDKRPMIQVYVPGQSVIACFLSGMWWEQECEPVEESDTVEIEGQTYPALTYKYHFAKNTSLREIDISGQSILPPIFTGQTPAFVTTGYEFTNGAYKFVYEFIPRSNYVELNWKIVRVSDSVVLWLYQYTGQNPPVTYPMEITLQPVAGSGATGTVVAYIHDLSVYARYILDVDTILGLNTYELPTDDLVDNNRNYHRAIGYAISDVIYFSTRLVTTPTQWGIYQPGQYYQQPYLYWFPELFPIARNSWGRVSIWFSFSAMDWLGEQSGRAEYTLKDAFPLWSVISVLLNKIAPGITHQATTDYSQFLYGTNPLSGIKQTLLITPKSNVISAGYDQPAQKAPITLKSVLDMLRDCFRCYWFVDAQGRFRIEHIRYFMLGGTYSGNPIVGTDLTAEKVTRNNKEWAFARNQYQFDKPEMAARYQFGWMDDVTQLFEGFPIDINSKYVNPDNIEEISVSQFTSDIDYILLNPGEISKDGFVLLAANDNSSFVNMQFESGTLMGIVGNSYEQTKVAATTRIRAKSLYYRSSNQITVSGFTSGYKVIFVYYDADLICVGSSNWITNSATINVPAACSSIGIVVANTSDTTITPSDYVTGNVTGIGLRLPYLNFVIDSADHYLQNAYVAFAYLQQYYAYDMPASQCSINGQQMYVVGTKKLKTQSIKFPLLNDPDLVKLVKTNVGNGMIQKLSVNLSNRFANATLKYDTE